MSPRCDGAGRRVGLLLVGALLVLAGCATPAPGPVLEPVPAAPVAAAPEPVTADDRLAPPARVRLAALGVDAAVVDVGVDDRGDMEVPEDVRTVGWYRFGPGAGAPAGSTVLSGHVDDRVQGEGAFYRLTDASVGDPVEVELADGTVVAYVVDRVQRIAKEELPVEQLFARDGAPVLTLVTCGGDFDREARSYRENVVVTARPVGTPPA